MPAKQPRICMASSPVGMPRRVLRRETSHDPARPLSPRLFGLTGNASLRLSTEEVQTALRRHASGDWGDLCPEDTLANDTALQHGGRLFSAYGSGADRFWIITESGRSVTTVLLPEDY